MDFFFYGDSDGQRGFSTRIYVGDLGAFWEKFCGRFSSTINSEKMLSMGVFGGVYFSDCPAEFPSDWYDDMKSSGSEKDPKLNFFGVHASMPLEHRQEKGWIYDDDPRGWFQWYARYYMGRRLPEEDRRQIRRWRAMKRHVGAIKKNCYPYVRDCRTKQRQALLHWAYDARVI